MNTNSHITYTNGIIGGLVGGVFFGGLMAMMGMVPMIAMMVGSESMVVGWIVHLLISAATGALFVTVFGTKVISYQTAILYGAGYGVIWWVLGALIIMPVILGMGVQFSSMFDMMRMMSLMGHVVFGVVLAVVAYKMG